MARLEVFRGDITKLKVDAIVNAANTSLLGGGGVDGAIHRAAGPELLRACERLGGCPTGFAKATPGFNLLAKWVFHAVGPVWNGGSHDEPGLLANCYRRCMELANEHEAKSIAFPAISTGIYHFPRQQAAEIAVRTVRDQLLANGLDQVIFCCFDEPTAQAYEKILAVGK